MTKSYSERCALARAVFADTQAKGLKTANDVLTFWGCMIEAGTALTMGAFKPIPRFDKLHFGGDAGAWKQAEKLLKIFEGVGCVERRKDGRSVEYVLVPEKFDPVLAASIAGRKSVRRKAESAPLPTPRDVAVKPEIRLVPTKPLRNKVEPSVAIIVDLANLTKHLHGGEGGRMILSPARMNWGAFLRHLASCGGKFPKVDRAVLCVSEVYYSLHYEALRCAEQHGFSVVKMFGEKDADPVVMSEIAKVVLDHLNIRYADRLPTIVLASGDKDFSAMIQVLRPFVQHEGLSLSLHVATWNAGLSRELYCQASEVLFIDDLLDSIDPFGASLRSKGGGAMLRRA